MTTTTTSIKVAEYRLLIDGLSYAFTSLRSVPSGCVTEQAREADWVRRSARELMDAHCPRARQEDRDMAKRLIDHTASYLINHGL